MRISWLAGKHKIARKCLSFSPKFGYRHQARKDGLPLLFSAYRWARRSPQRINLESDVSYDTTKIDLVHGGDVCCRRSMGSRRVIGGLQMLGTWKKVDACWLMFSLYMD